MELIVKTIDVPGDSSYKDGDIVQAFSNDRIHMCHAEMICSPDSSPLNTVTGLRSNDGLLMKFTEAVSKYKFVRLNTNEVKRINLIDSSEDIISNTANANGERIDIHQFLKTRLSFKNHKIFGSSGAEIWYGGSRQHNIQDIWNDIETHTDNLMVDHSSWPLTDTEKRHFLPLNASGFKNGSISEISSDTVNTRHSPAVKTETVDGEQQVVVVAQRQWQVPYWDLSTDLGININDVRNMEILLDARKPQEERPYIDNINVDKVSAGIIEF